MPSNSPAGLPLTATTGDQTLQNPPLLNTRPLRDYPDPTQRSSHFTSRMGASRKTLQLALSHSTSKARAALAGTRGCWRAVAAAVALLFIFTAVSNTRNSPIAMLSQLDGRDRSDASSGIDNLGRRADFAEVPQFCSEIVKNPQYFDKECHRKTTDFTCDSRSGKSSGKTLMFSQFRQDYYLYTRHFKNLTRRGIYLDVAANVPIFISNTYFLDRCLGWAGVCVEGNPKYLESLSRERSCKLMPTCVTDKDGEQVTFLLSGGAGGVQGHGHKHEDMWARQNKTINTINLRCTTLAHVAKRSGLRVVDYMSLDVEGAELIVLKGIDWDKLIINVITIEVREVVLPGIEEYLKTKGYVRHKVDIPDFGKDKWWGPAGLLQEDVVFLHKSVVFGSPV